MTGDQVPAVLGNGLVTSSQRNKPGGARAAAQPGGQADRLWSLARGSQSLITSLGRLDGVVNSIPCLSPLTTRY